MRENPDEEQISRRVFFKGAVGLIGSASALAGTVAMAAPHREPHAKHKMQGTGMKKVRRFAFVGTYSADGAGAPFNGKGIYVFELDQESGALVNGRLAAESSNPSWLALHPSGKCLYAIDELANFQGANGAVAAYAIKESDGSLKLLNQVSSHGAGPAHMSVDHAGKHVFVANYAGGSVTVLRINEDGSLGEVTDTRQDTGSVGAGVPTNAPRGSFAISGHDAPHAHCIIPSPDDRYVLHTDLGQDRIYIYKFDASTGKLSPAEAPFVSLPSGDGPRHLAFHPNRRWFYSIQEEASTVAFFHWDPTTGTLKQQQMVSTLPDSFAGTNFTSEILVSKDGRFVYAANRLHDTVAVFSIAADGTLKRIANVSSMGDYIRHVATDPEGNFLYCSNRRSDSVTWFRIDRHTGIPSLVGYVGVGSPACIVFL